MRGITEERLGEILNSPEYIHRVPFSLLSLLGRECTELNPWKPIDENTPKDRIIWGFVEGKKRLIKWGKTSHVPLYGFCLADQGTEDFDICKPTHWCELPDDPK